MCANVCQHQKCLNSIFEGAAYSDVDKAQPDKKSRAYKVPIFKDGRKNFKRHFHTFILHKIQFCPLH